MTRIHPKALRERLRSASRGSESSRDVRLCESDRLKIWILVLGFWGYMRFGEVWSDNIESVDRWLQADGHWRHKIDDSLRSLTSRRRWSDANGEGDDERRAERSRGWHGCGSGRMIGRNQHFWQSRQGGSVIWAGRLVEEFQSLYWASTWGVSGIARSSVTSTWEAWVPASKARCQNDPSGY